MNEKPLAYLIDSLLPKYIVDQYPQYVEFVKTYLELLEEETSPWTVLNNITDYIDISITPESNLQSFIEQYISSFPTEHLSGIDIREFITNAKTFYSEKGNEAAVRFIFNLVGGSLEFYYPSTEIFETNSSFLSGPDKIHDNYYYAYYVYEIISDLDSTEYEDIIRKMCHPIGEKLFFKKLVWMGSEGVLFDATVLDSTLGFYFQNDLLWDFSDTSIIDDTDIRIESKANFLIGNLSEVIGDYFFSQTGNNIEDYQHLTFDQLKIKDSPPFEVSIWLKAQPLVSEFYVAGKNDFGTIVSKDGNPRFSFVMTSFADPDTENDDWEKLIGGSNSTVGLKPDGTVWGVGADSNGQLGQGGTYNVPLTQLMAGTFTEIAVGLNHTVILRDDGTAWGSGYNADGQLGTGSSTGAVLSFIEILTNVAHIACGANHTMAIKNDGTVWGVGHNGSGQLGDNSITERYNWQEAFESDHVTSLDAIAIACGSYHTFITLNTSNEINVTGMNGYGQLGLGHKTNQRYFVPLTGITGELNLIHYESFIIDGTNLYAAGQNSSSQLCLNHANEVLTFTLVISDCLGVAGDLTGTLILKEDGTLWVSGVQTTYGQFGLGHTNPITTLTANGEEDFVQIWSGLDCFIARKNSSFSSDVPCICGYLYNGIEDNVQKDALATIALFSKSYLVRNIGVDSTTESSVMSFVTEDNKMYGAGTNNYYELGNDTTDTFIEFQQIGIDEDWYKVFNGYYYSFAIKTDGTLWSVGVNTNGQLGLGDNVNKITWTQVGIDEDWEQVSCGISSSVLALKTDGTLYGCGIGGQGQLGVTGGNTFTVVPGVSTVSECRIGSNYSLILLDNGDLYATGFNSAGQFGIVSANTTAFIFIMSDVAKIACGNTHSMIIKVDGSLWATGTNNVGQLGLGDTAVHTLWEQVGSDTNWAEISLASTSSIALKTDGTLYGTGQNGYGILGLNDTTIRSTFEREATNHRWRIIGLCNHFGFSVRARVPVYQAKSLIFDVADNYGGANMGIRSIEFVLGETLKTLTPADFTVYGEEFDSTLIVDNAFETGLSKTGAAADTSWVNLSGNTDQRFIVVLDDIMDFSEIIINNYHDSATDTDFGLRNVKVHISEQTITDLTYDAVITAGELYFDGMFWEHSPSDEENDLIPGETSIYDHSYMPNIKGFETMENIIASYDITCDKPAGVEIGDLLVIIVFSDHSYGTEIFIDNKVGWTFQGSTIWNTDSSTRLAVYTRIADGLEGATETITAEFSEQSAMAYLDIDGVDPLNPVNGINFGLSTGGTVHNISSITTDKDNCLVLYGLAFDGGDGYPFSVSGTGWLQVGQETNDQNSGAGLSMCFGFRRLTTAGASGDAVVTSSIYDGSSFSQIAINSWYVPIIIDGTFTFIDLDTQGSTYYGVWADANFVYVSCYSSGLRTYSVDSGGFLTYIDSDFQGGNYFEVWGDGDFIYAACYGDGIRSYSVDGSGILTFIDHIDPGGHSRGLWGDGTFIYTASAATGLVSFSADGSGNLTQKDSDFQGDNYWGVHGDGNFIYCACRLDGIRSYSVDESGILTFIDSDMQGGDSYEAVYSDGNFIYAACYYGGLRSYSVDESGILTFIDHDDQGDRYQGLWGDGTFIYCACGDDGVRSYSVDESGILTFERAIDPNNHSNRVVVYDNILYSGMNGGLYSFSMLGLTDYNSGIWVEAEATFESGIGSWVGGGTNTVENDNKTLKITYVDNVNGAWNYLNAANDLTEDLIVDATYRITCDVKVNTGRSFDVVIYTGASYDTFGTCTTDYFTRFTTDFIAKSTTSCKLQFGLVSALEIIWLDNISLIKL